jgi:hypothetical protein
MCNVQGHLIPAPKKRPQPRWSTYAPAPTASMIELTRHAPARYKVLRTLGSARKLGDAMADRDWYTVQNFLFRSEHQSAVKSAQHQQISSQQY